MRRLTNLATPEQSAEGAGVLGGNRTRIGGFAGRNLTFRPQGRGAGEALCASAVAGADSLELPTSSFGDSRSTRLSYAPKDDWSPVHDSNVRPLAS